MGFVQCLFFVSAKSRFDLIDSRHTSRICLQACANWPPHTPLNHYLLGQLAIRIGRRQQCIWAHLGSIRFEVKLLDRFGLGVANGSKLRTFHVDLLQFTVELE